MNVTDTLNSKNVAELRKLAACYSIAGRSTMKKAELIDKLIDAGVETRIAIDEITPEQQARFAEQVTAAGIRSANVVEKSNVEAVTADKIVPAGMFDPELTYYADGTHVVMRARGTEQQGIAVGMTTDASPYQFQAVRFADGTVKNVAPHVLHRAEIAEETAVVAEPSVYEDPAVRAAIHETVAEQATYIEEGIEMDEADAAEYETLPDQVAIMKYAANDAIATAAFAGTTIGGHVTRERGRWVLRDQTHTIRAKTLGKVGKLWAKQLGFRATTIDIAAMS